MRVALRHTMEIVAGLVAISVVLIGVFIWQLAKGPVSFGRFTSQIETILSAASDNVDVEIENAVLAWSQEDRMVYLQAIGVDLNDPQGLQIGHVPRIEIDISAPDLLRGKVIPTRVELQGPSAMIVRRHDGSFQLGFGPTQGGAAKEKEEADEGASNRGRVFTWLVNEMGSDDEKSSALSALKKFSISDAKIEFYDETSGSLWVAPEAVVSIARGDAGISWDMSGQVHVGAEEVSVSLMGHINAETKWISTSMEFTDISLSSFAAKSNYFSDLADFDFPINGQARIEIDNNGELQTAELELGAGEGSFRFKEFGEDKVPVEYGAFSASYNGDRQWFDIRRLHFVAGENRATLAGTAQISFSTKDQLRILGFGFDLAGKDIAFNVPARMEHVVAIDELKLVGSVDLANRWINLKTFDLNLDGAQIALSGDIFDAEGSPAIVAQGTLKNLPVEKVDVVWPKGLALGARDWVTANIQGGTITEGDLTINAPAGAFADLANHPDVLRFDFSLKGAAVRYIRGLPQVVDTAADMVLTTARFDAEITNGRIVDIVGEDLVVGKGSTVSIPQLRVKGSPILIQASIEGQTQDILTVINQEPLGYLKRFGLNPLDIGGRARGTMNFSIPSLRRVSLDTIGFSAEAELEQLTMPSLFAELPVDDGTLKLSIDLNGLQGDGEISIAGVPSKVHWTENFKAGNDISSEFLLSTNLNESAQIDWGLDTHGALTGDVPVDLIAKGRGPKISEIEFEADMTQSNIDIRSIDFRKSPGEAAKAEMLVKFTEAGALYLENFKITGERLDVSGTVSLARNGKLNEALFKRIWIDDFIDVRFRADRDDSQSLHVSVIGDYLNISPFLVDMMTEFGGGDPNSEEDSAEPSPWSFDGQVNDLYLRSGVALKDVTFDVISDGEKFTALNLEGEYHESGSVFASLTQGEVGSRHLVVAATDGGRLIRGITGVNQVVGGELALKMDFDDPVEPPADEMSSYSMAEYLNAYAAARAKAGDQAEIEDEAIMAALEDGQTSLHDLERSSTTSGYLKIDDFKIVKAPILAQLLTVGSLRGLGDTLNGDGIHFESLEAPFWVNEEGVIGVSDATAAGSALGLTLVGTFDQAANSTDFEGTIVPSYTLNTALGNLPLLGPMLVSREGEGVFAFTYGISGPTDGPTVYVNPLSGLAPGFFRRVFQVRDQKEARGEPVQPSGNTSTDETKLQ